MKKIITLGCLLLISSLTFAQINLEVEGSGIITKELSVGTTSIDAKAQTQIDATDKGLLIPRMNNGSSDDDFFFWNYARRSYGL